jgi:endonuclease YncB( thermonuclease family)
VIDGDTIEIHGERIRLDGIDAPESWQTCEDADGLAYPCGRLAADALEVFLAASRPTRCEIVSNDRYGRQVGICFRDDGAEVNAWLVSQGHALDWPRYSKGRYSPQQADAEAARRGMWRGDFVEPWTARKLRR